MKPEQSKRFRYSEKQSGQTNLFSGKQEIRQQEPGMQVDQLPFALMVRKLMKGLMRLLVAARYQLHRLFPNAHKLPWLKIAAAVVLAFVVFRRDLQFQLNLQSPFGQEIADDQETRASRLSTVGTWSTPISPERAPEKVVDPFADHPDDDEKDRRFKEYIRRFKDIAITEMEKYKIPASVKMAQGLIESNGGSSRLASNNNNHFGIKCFSKSCKKGHCSNFSDDHHKDFFRVYKSAWESWRAHSKMIVGGRYKELIKHGNDYKAWAKGLKEMGYATDDAYTEKLIRTIEKYHLYVLDQGTPR